MNLFIDTTQSNFVACVFNEDFKIIKKTIKLTKYKVEEITNFFDEFNDINSIKNIYINLGPGTFTGSRISLIYVRTLCQILNINLFTINTFDLIRNIKNNFYFFNKVKKICIPSTKNKSYCQIGNKGNIFQSSKNRKQTIIDYEYVLNNFANICKYFIKSDSITSIEPIYASNPQIGDVK